MSYFMMEVQLFESFIIEIEEVQMLVFNFHPNNHKLIDLMVFNANSDDSDLF
jgi:hypothetical protein